MYCRNCGQKLTLRFCENEGLIPYCDTCEKYVFPQFAVAVSMVVTNREQNKILLAKHVEDDDFILFAGYVKKGENAEKTVPREIKEELGVNVVEDAPLKVNAEEISEVRWCTFDEAAALIRKGTTAEFFLNNAIKELKRKI